MVRMATPTVRRGMRQREGRGFSIEELRSADLNVGEARRLGIPVDLNRRTSHEDNVEKLKEWVAEAKKSGLRFPKPKQIQKSQAGRPHRGLTSSGKKMRGLKA